MIATIATTMTTARSRITVALIPDLLIVAGESENLCGCGKPALPLKSPEVPGATATRETSERFRSLREFVL
jgi:hypothetical protein